jgi:SAM-dependent methyltransferase
MKPPRADYGLDAPGVVRNLLLIGGLLLVIWVAIVSGLWSGVLWHVDFHYIALSAGLSVTLTGVWMIWSSRFGKVRDREQWLDQIKWRGDEQVLDIGCGRGLMLIGAAKRLTTGMSTGIDIWQSEDLTGNRPEATLENARREGVAERVEVKTADMRQLPFADGSFDVVLSCAAIHNLYVEADRTQAIREVARVLKPGGQALIADIRHTRHYAVVFEQHGCEEVRRLDSPILSGLCAVITWGSLRPATLLVRKSS